MRAVLRVFHDPKPGRGSPNRPVRKPRGIEATRTRRTTLKRPEVPAEFRLSTHPSVGPGTAGAHHHVALATLDAARPSARLVEVTGRDPDAAQHLPQRLQLRGIQHAEPETLGPQLHGHRLHRRLTGHGDPGQRAAPVARVG